MTQPPSAVQFLLIHLWQLIPLRFLVPIPPNNSGPCGAIQKPDIHTLKNIFSIDSIGYGVRFAKKVFFKRITYKILNGRLRYLVSPLDTEVRHEKTINPH